MWLAEALWHARISPWLRLDEATDGELGAALAWAQRSMRASVAGTEAPGRSTAGPDARADDAEAIRSHGPWATPIAPRTGAQDVSEQETQLPPP